MTSQWARKDPEHLQKIIQLAVERGFDIEEFERTCTRGLHGFAAIHDAVDRIDTVQALQDRVHELEGEHIDHLREVTTHADRRILRLRALADGYRNRWEMATHENGDINESMLMGLSEITYLEGQKLQLTAERDEARARVAELEDAIREEMGVADVVLPQRP